MKTNILPIVLSIAIGVCGCTSIALQHSALNQSRTVSDVLAEQVLYNLAVAKNFNEGKTYNGIPSFVTLVSGQSQIQDSITPQLGIAFPVHGGGNQYNPQVSGAHQTQDNWAFAPVVDPSVLNRLYWLYRAEVTNISEKDIDNNIFPAQQDLDPSGRPQLQYEAVPDPNNPGKILMTNNQPVFTAKPKEKKPRDVKSIPGAWLDNTGNKINKGWFTFASPTTQNPKPLPVGPYQGRTFWVTNYDNFMQFALLALGGTNGSSTLIPPPSFLMLQNGFLIQTPRQPFQ